MTIGLKENDSSTIDTIERQGFVCKRKIIRRLKEDDERFDMTIGLQEKDSSMIDMIERGGLVCKERTIL